MKNLLFWILCLTSVVSYASIEEFACTPVGNSIGSFIFQVEFEGENVSFNDDAYTNYEGEETAFSYLGDIETLWLYLVYGDSSSVEVNNNALVIEFTDYNSSVEAIVEIPRLGGKSFMFMERDFEEGTFQFNCERKQM